MKYFIGKVPEQDLEVFGTSDLFEHEGSYFYNKIEFGSNPGGVEDFVISDTCGRSIPLSTEQIDVLIGALVDMRCKLHALEAAEELQDCLSDPFCVHTFE